MSLPRIRSPWRCRPNPPITLQGPEHARVVVVEYGDFECPSCKVAATTPTLLMERFPNQVRFIFRQFSAGGSASARAAGGGSGGGRRGPRKILADVRCAVPQPGASQGRGPAALRARAGPGHGALHGGDGRSHLSAESARAHRERAPSHIRATPAFFVNGVVQDISFGMKALHDAVAAAVSQR